MRARDAEKLVLVLRDGRKLIGVLRSWDQFGTSPLLPPPFPFPQSPHNNLNPPSPPPPIRFTLSLTLPPSQARADFGIKANLVLQDTIERIFIADLYADVPRGIFLVRGENVLLLGEV
ncbi:hypothetical protein Q9189_006314, partial [Teloschistes chrysophthalmus]